ncbi:hypothetical protein GCM10023339_12350 [Alloalcanivorax gelatiniphagus]
MLVLRAPAQAQAVMAIGNDPGDNDDFGEGGGHGVWGSGTLGLVAAALKRIAAEAAPTAGWVEP